jgi:hypothetical protein
VTASSSDDSEHRTLRADAPSLPPSLPPSPSLLSPAQDIAEAKRLLAAEPLRVFGRDPFLLMGLASDGTVGLLPGRGGRAGAGGLFKAVDFALAAEMAGLQSSES